MTVMFAASLVRLGLHKKAPKKPGCLKKIKTVGKFDGLQGKPTSGTNMAPPTGLTMDDRYLRLPSPANRRCCVNSQDKIKS